MNLFSSKAFKQGVSFGVVSSVMTVLGLSVGIWTSGGQIETLIASMLGLSLSNALADAFSIYMANLATKENSMALQSALITGIIEFGLPFIFVIPILFLQLTKAIIVNIIMGFILVSYMGYYVSKLNNLDRNTIIKRIFLYGGILTIILVSTTISGYITKKLEPGIKKINSAFTH